MKQRLDMMVAQKAGISREKAQALIMAGVVFVDGQKATKSGQSYPEDIELDIKETSPYVSRGALKLEKAYQDFDLEFTGKTICDVGASTGGFTDFALQNGATKVYAIDTGKGQIAQKLHDDPRVTLLENTNIKSVESLPEKIDFFVIDVSFISLTKVLPSCRTIEDSARVIALIKPQFEVGKVIADKNRGIIKDSQIQLDTVRKIGDFAESIGYSVKALSESPITGAKGNKEYLIYLQ
jgi:23S rRNA (cytidine1920-2'-O)/16S rRNA (cytidine1409-2'-O)-methyltransferase